MTRHNFWTSGKGSFGIALSLCKRPTAGSRRGRQEKSTVEIVERGSGVVVGLGRSAGTTRFAGTKVGLEFLLSLFSRLISTSTAALTSKAACPNVIRTILSLSSSFSLPLPRDPSKEPEQRPAETREVTEVASSR